MYLWASHTPVDDKNEWLRNTFATANRFDRTQQSRAVTDLICGRRAHFSVFSSTHTPVMHVCVCSRVSKSRLVLHVLCVVVLTRLMLGEVSTAVAIPRLCKSKLTVIVTNLAEIHRRYSVPILLHGTTSLSGVEPKPGHQKKAISRMF